MTASRICLPGDIQSGKYCKNIGLGWTLTHRSLQGCQSLNRSYKFTLCDSGDTFLARAGLCACSQASNMLSESNQCLYCEDNTLDQFMPICGCYVICINCYNQFFGEGVFELLRNHSSLTSEARKRRKCLVRSAKVSMHVVSCLSPCEAVGLIRISTAPIDASTKCT